MSASNAARFYECLYRFHSGAVRCERAQVWGSKQRRLSSRSLCISTRTNTFHRQAQCRFGTAPARPLSTNASKPDPATTTEPSSLSEPLRYLMRRVPHPVAIITASQPSSGGPYPPPPETTFRGMTVSSFNTITLSPIPYVSFNVKLPSASYSAIQETEGGVFLAHFVAANPSGARIADAFARGAPGGGAEVFRKLVLTGGSGDKPGALKVFAGRGSRSAPMLVGQGILRVLRCRYSPEHEVTVGDHKVVVAEVIGIVGEESQTDGELQDPRELVITYVDRGFREIGEKIEPLELGAPDARRRTEEPQDAGFVKTMGMNVRTGEEGL